MRLKSYFAASVEAAINTARIELGPDAMLVHSRRCPEETRHLGEYEVVFASDTRTGAHVVEAPAAAPAKPAPVDKLSQEVSALKQEMEKLAAALARSSTGMTRIAANAELCEIFTRMIDAEVDADIAQAVVSRVAAQLEEGANASSAALAAAELLNAIRTDSRLAPEQCRAVALVGPPGAGKTSTLVKLAVHYGLRARKSCHILSADAHRVAATDQLRAYAAIAGIGFQVVETPSALLQALDEHRAKDIVFIDTPGLARDEFEDAGELIRAVAKHPAIETHLVLNASVRAADMRRAVARYDGFSPAKLIFTHLDEASAFGALLSLPLKSGKPVSFLADGQEIPDDLRPAANAGILDLILPDASRDRRVIAATAA